MTEASLSLAASPPQTRAIMDLSLEAVAEAGVDIVPLFFHRFFAAFPEDRAMFHNPRASEGAMVTEIMTMLLAQAGGEPWVGMMMRNQVATHHDHGDIPPDRYRRALDLFVDILGETAGSRWRDEYEAAWRGEAGKLADLIERYY